MLLMIPSLTCIYICVLFFFFSFFPIVFNPYQNERLKELSCSELANCGVIFVISIKPTVQKVLSIKHTAKDLFNTFPTKTDKYGLKICFICTRAVVIMSSPRFHNKCLTKEPNHVLSGVESVKIFASFRPFGRQLRFV